jgi:hypothetical protein
MEYLSLQDLVPFSFYAFAVGLSPLALSLV